MVLHRSGGTTQVPGSHRETLDCFIRHPCIAILLLCNFGKLLHLVSISPLVKWKRKQCLPHDIVLSITGLLYIIQVAPYWTHSKGSINIRYYYNNESGTWNCGMSKGHELCYYWLYRVYFKTAGSAVLWSWTDNLTSGMNLCPHLWNGVALKWRSWKCSVNCQAQHRH